MEEILKLAKKEAEIAEIFYAESQQIPVIFEAGSLKSIESKQSEVWALRVVRQGREGFAICAGDISRRELVSMAIECAQFGQQVAYKLPSALDESVHVKTFDKQTEQYSSEKMVEHCQVLCDYVKSLNGDIVAEAQIEKAYGTVRLANSEGFEGTYQKSHLEVGIGGTLVRGTDMLFLSSGHSSVNPELNFDFIKSETSRQYEWARKGNAAIKNGHMPVIFTPEGFASAFMPSLLSALNGKIVLMGASPLAEMLGKQAFDSRFNLIDAQLEDWRPASRPFDAEGASSQKLTLCKEGFVEQFIYDGKTAWQAQKSSTSSAGRSGGAPAPSYTNLMCSNGQTPFIQMVSNIKEGLIVENLLGAGQGNTLSGDFSGNVLLGYKIENGQIVGRVKDVMISGNTFILLKEIDDIGNDGRFIDNFYSPSFTFSKVYVASK